MKQILLLLMVITFSIVLKAQTQIELYNNTNKSIYSAYAYWDNSNGCWSTKGWFEVAKYSSITINIGQYEGNVYIHGKQSTLLEEKKWGSGQSFCIDPKNAFEIRFADQSNCSKRGDFSQMAVRTGINKWVFSE